MRVLLTIHNFLPQARAGSQLYALYLARSLSAAGHVVHLMHGEDAAEREVIHREWDGIPCTVLRRPSRYSCRWLGSECDPRVETAFRDLLATFKPDVVHVQHLLGLSLQLPQIARDVGVPVVFTLHDYWLHCVRLQYLMPGNVPCDGPAPQKCAVCCRGLAKPHPLRPPGNGETGWLTLGWTLLLTAGRRWLTAPRWGVDYFRQRQERVRRLADAVSVFIAPSRYLAERVTREGLPGEQVFHLDYGMDTGLFAEVRDCRDAARLRFGYVGTMTGHKGVHVLLEAFEGFLEADLILYGKENRRLWSRYRHVLQQPNVVCAGILQDDQKAAAFGRLDALIVPSIWNENSPLVIREAFLAGVPVVTSNLGGIAELARDGVGALHFAPGNPADLRAKLAAVCTDPGQLRRLRRGIPRVKSMEEHVPELIDVYQRAISSPACASSAEPNGNGHAAGKVE